MVKVLVWANFGQTDTDRSARGGCPQIFLHGDEATLRLDQAAAGKTAYKLITTVAHHNVIGSQPLPQGPTHLSQQTVTGGMPLRIVDPFQVIDVKERDD